MKFVKHIPTVFVFGFLIFAISCAMSPEEVDREIATAKEITADLKAALKEQREIIANAQATPEDIAKAEQTAKLFDEVIKKGDAYINFLTQNRDKLTDPLQTTGAVLTEASKHTPPQIGVWIGMIGALLSSVGGNVAQRVANKRTKAAATEVIQLIQANRDSNGGSARFTPEYKAVLENLMTPAGKKLVAESKDAGVQSKATKLFAMAAKLAEQDKAA